MAELNDLYELILKGTAFERGFQHGKLLVEDIRPRVERLWQAAELHMLRIAPLIAAMQALIERLFPAFNKEMEGISRGADLPFEKVFLYNNRDIIGVVEGDFCSHMCINDGKSIIVGMNKDAPVKFFDKYMVKKVYPSEGYAFVGYGHVGRLWGHGMNEAGVCTAGTAANGSGDVTTCSALGLYFLPPLILSACRSAEQAMELVMGIETISGSGNILLADATGVIMIVEISPSKRVVRKADNGIICSSNFFASGKLEHNDTQERLDESYARYAVLKSILKTGGNNAIETIQRAMRHHDAIGSICRHNILGFNTVLSYYAALNEKKVFVANGFPCLNEYHSYTL
ncbi:MAG: C45 family autoproteolytic acyltransferase/hydrolase [Sedimentisphaerales bacterium]